MASESRPITQESVRRVLGAQLDRRTFLQRAAMASVAGAGATLAMGGLRGVRAQSPSEGFSDATVELWSWNGGTNYENVYKDAIARFGAAFPGSSLAPEYLDFATYVTRAKTAMAGNVPPDLLQMPWAGDFLDIVKAGSLAPLDDVLANGFPEFFPSLMESVSYDGHVWAVPLDVNNLTIAYNTDVFQELGLAVPTTADELIAVAQAIRTDGRYAPLSMSVKDGWPAGDVWFAQAAYTTESDAAIRDADRGQLPWDDAGFVAASQAVKKLIDGGVFSDDAQSISTLDAVNVFGQKKSAMYYPMGNFIRNIVDTAAGGPGKLPYDVMAFPPLDAGEQPVATGGIAVMFSIPAAAKQPAAAAEVLRLLTDAGGRDTLLQWSFSPASPAEAPATWDAIDRHMLSFQASARTRAIFTPATYAALTNGVQGLFAGAYSPEDIASEMVSAQQG